MACARIRKGRRYWRLLPIVLLGAASMGQVMIVGNGVMTITSADDGPETPTVFTVPMADTKTIDKLDDFDRYVNKKAWELAFRTMNAVEADSKGMVPPASGGTESGKGKGFLFPATVRIKQSLIHLPPEGRDAYRLFNDAAAKALWEKVGKARSPGDGVTAIATASDEAATLRKIVNQYFLTSIGDLAADRLGDVLFEQGNFAEAAAVWQSAVEEYPDGHLPAAQLQVKRCVALARMGRREELAGLVESVKQTYAGQKVTIGGQQVDAAEFAAGLSADSAEDAATQPLSPATMAANGSAATSEPAAGPIDVLSKDDPLWQIRVTRTNAMQAMEQQIVGMGWAVDIHFVGAVPTAAIAGNRLFVNWMGVIYAADLQTGKMLWRTGKFSEITERATMFAQYGVNPDHFAISAGAGKVFGLRVDPTRMQQGNGGAYTLDAFDAETGKSAWTANGMGTVLTEPYVPEDVSGGEGGVGYVVAVANDQTMTLGALDLKTGRTEWTAQLGRPLGQQNNYGGGMLYGLPAIMAANGMVYVATNNGAMVAVNAAEHRVEWAFKNDTKPVATERIYYSAMPRVFETPVTLLEEGGVVYLKDSSAPTMYAIDPDAPALKWRRRIGPEEMVIGIRGQVAYLLGQDLSALDMNTRQLLWSVRIPVGTGLLRPLVEEGHIYVASQRGIYDVDSANGDVLHIFRGADREATGGRLYVAHLAGTGGGSPVDELICVTDSAVTAYPLETKSGQSTPPPLSP
jgi:outer membrane protein assembly factor BamB